MAERSFRLTLQQVGLGLMIGAIIITFVLFFGQPSGPSRTTDVVAQVDGEPLGRDAFEFFRQQALAAQRDALPPDLEDQTIRDIVDRQTLGTLLQRAVMAQGAAELGFRVSNRELSQEICSNPNFQTDGRCDRDLYELFVSRSEFDNMRSYEQEVKRDLLVRKLRRVIEGSVRLSALTVEERLRRAQLKVRLRYASAPRAQFADAVSISDDEARGFAESDRPRLEQLYQSRIREFQRPEEARVSHILFIGDDGAARASSARSRVDAGESFADVASEVSDDVATKGGGGVLGLLPRGRMLPAFDAAAFSAEIGEVVGPVETERGLHLIRVEERRAAIDRSLDEVSVELARELMAADATGAAARAAASRMADALRAGTPFENAAVESGLELAETGPITPRDRTIAGLGAVPGIVEAAFALREPGSYSTRVFEAATGAYVISLLERIEPADEEIAEQIEPLREQLLQGARLQALGDWYQSRSEELERTERLITYPLYTN